MPKIPESNSYPPEPELQIVEVTTPPSITEDEIADRHEIIKGIIEKGMPTAPAWKDPWSNPGKA